MITQRRQTYASHVDFDPFTVFMRLFRCKKFGKTPNGGPKFLLTISNGFRMVLPCNA